MDGNKSLAAVAHDTVADKTYPSDDPILDYTKISTAAAAAKSNQEFRVAKLTGY
ncbi:hypothetical protein [Dyadobacter sp. CY356]|uniref:hypothetical protein n=1 Tax=Dyadobacter sp. CY356 TaxID=2906442 RepID=UPI001F458A46|nr:hypothetical protein [Dyadobacter sp. CY356]MCF0055202.1 hypothetical protein [Dyadobacter sp. CY356]